MVTAAPFKIPSVEPSQAQNGTYYPLPMTRALRGKEGESKSVRSKEKGVLKVREFLWGQGGCGEVRFSVCERQCVECRVRAWERGNVSVRMKSVCNCAVCRGKGSGVVVRVGVKERFFSENFRVERVRGSVFFSGCVWEKILESEDWRMVVEKMGKENSVWEGSRERGDEL
ncbi:hypothetical protein COLO4_07292 [Corchorus olitorius]|uniref:Uncharacterized protein n=1 Tax=Corchorus olitorius TaxID=93759 RepID=A0A1R3KKB8_9ROSI|nr:hypothetical protein COLO4_07292 [Corchorus olitorius]